MFPIIACSILALVVLLLIVISSRPATFSVTRSVLIAAPPARVFVQVADFHAWLAWSPWEGLDPNLKRTYGSVPAGVGATYDWVGSAKVGAGGMTITEARPGEHLGIDLVFLKPFAAKNRTTFDFASSGAGTTVTWTMSGKNTFMGKACSLLMNMDRLIGGSFEKGLAQLKTVCEATA